MDVLATNISVRESHEQEILARQMESVREVLNANVDQLLLHIKHQMGEIQKETFRRCEASSEIGDVVQLKKDLESLRCSNEHLRSQLQAQSQGGLSCIQEKTKSKPPGSDMEAKTNAVPKIESEGQHSAPPPEMESGYSSPKGDGGSSHMKDSSAWSQPNQFPPRPDAEAKMKGPSSSAPTLPISSYSPSKPTKVAFGSVEEEEVGSPMGTQSSARPGMKRASTFQVGGHTHSEPKAVFADATAMKEKVRLAVTKKEYNVCDYYWDTGIVQHVARAQWFEYTTLFVIAFNAVWISIDADLNTSLTLLEAEPVFQIAEHSFCLYFSWEWAMRFISFKQKKNCFRDAWFCFDSFLVFMMVMETWVGTIIIVLTSGGSGGSGMGNTSVLKLVRLVRLTRMARMAKLLRAIPELIILIKGIAVASRSVCFTLLLLGIIIYFFAIVNRTLAADTDVGEMYFPSVPDAMMSLLMDGVLPDQAQIVRDCSEESFILGIITLIFILLGTLTVMNMLVGVLCEVVSVVSSVEKETLTVGYVKMRLQSMFGEWDTDGSMTISRPEFQRLLMMPEAAKIIHEIGVDVVGLVDFADFIFKDDRDLSFADFMECVLSFRGSNSSTVKDVVDLRKFVLSELTATKDELAERLDSIATGMQGSFQEANKQVMARMTTFNHPPRGDDGFGGASLLPSFSMGSHNDQLSLVSSKEDEIIAVDTPSNNSFQHAGQQHGRNPGRRPMSRPGTGVRQANNDVGSRPNSRPGSRPNTGLSVASRTRSCSPPLPDYPKSLWLQEDDDKLDNAEWNGGNYRVGIGRKL
jgi:hypothetical protein